MKKLLCLFLLAVMAGTSYAGEKSLLRLGLLSKMNSTEEQFAEIWQKTFAPQNGNLEIIVKFYDTLTAMQLDLENGSISQMVLPYAPAQYILNQNKNYESALILHSDNMGLAFGFREDSRELRDKFNEALRQMRADWSLSAIEGLYLASPGVSEPGPVEFERFTGARTIRVAVTGDMPPIDYIAPDGTPAGFNTAVLAEIGSRLHVNIELLDIASGARTAALASGRADVVFWYEVDTSSRFQADVPEGVILSEPYYEWNRFIHIKKASRVQASRNWSIKNDIMSLFFTD